jgi:hypothetical protein
MHNKKSLNKLLNRVSLYLFITILLAFSATSTQAQGIFGGSGGGGSSIFDGIRRGVETLFNNFTSGLPGGVVIPGLGPTPVGGGPSITPSSEFPPVFDPSKKIKLTLDWDAVSVGTEAVNPQSSDPLEDEHKDFLRCPPCPARTQDAPQHTGETWHYCAIQTNCAKTEIQHVLYGWCGHKPKVINASRTPSDMQLAYEGPNTYTLPSAVSNKYVRRDGYAYKCVRQCDGGYCEKDNYMEFQTEIYKSNAISMYIRVENVTEFPIENVTVRMRQLSYDGSSSPLPHQLDFPDGGGYVHGNTLSSYNTTVNGVPLKVEGGEFVIGPFYLPTNEPLYFPLQPASTEISDIALGVEMEESLSVGKNIDSNDESVVDYSFIDDLKTSFIKSWDDLSKPESIVNQVVPKVEAAGTCGWGWNMWSMGGRSPQEMRSLMQSMLGCIPQGSCNGGSPVVRLWNFDQNNPNMMQNVLDAAQGLDVKFVISLGDWNGNPGRNWADWYGSGYRNDGYRNWVQQQVSQYGSNPNIIWEILNEPHCDGGGACPDNFVNFMDDISTLIADNSPSGTLISAGMKAFIGEDLADGTYERIINLPNITAGSCHYYNTRCTQWESTNGVQGCLAAKAMTKAQGKFFYVGEAGNLSGDTTCNVGGAACDQIQCTPTSDASCNASGDLEARKNKMLADMAAIGADLFLPWQYNNEGDPNCDKFSVHPGDPLCNSVATPGPTLPPGAPIPTIALPPVYTPNDPPPPDSNSPGQVEEPGGPLSPIELSKKLGKGGMVPRDFNFICQDGDDDDSERCGGGGKPNYIISKGSDNFKEYRDTTGIGGCGYWASSNNSVVGPFEITAEYGGTLGQPQSRSVLLAAIPIGGRILDMNARPFGWPANGAITEDWGRTGEATAQGVYRSNPSQLYGAYRLCQ